MANSRIGSGSGICGFCGRQGGLTRDHFLSRALSSEEGTADIVSPVKGKHAVGNRLVLPDVCADCNSGPLSQLDEYAKSWLELGAKQLPGPDSGERLLRWCARFACNARRAGSSGPNWRPIPEGLPLWVVRNGIQNPGFRALLSWTHPARGASRSFAYGEMTDATNGFEAQILMREWTFLLSWQYPGEPIPLDTRVAHVAEDFQAWVIQEGEAVNPRLVPRARRPDWNLESMLSDDGLRSLHSSIRKRLSRAELGE